MPRLTQNENMQSHQVAGGGNFTFTATRVEKLTAANGYTVVDIVLDRTGSTAGFEQELYGALVAAIEGCRKSPQAKNLLIRVTEFNSTIPGNVREVHGYKLLSEIDSVNDYPITPSAGGTPLFDAEFSAVGSMDQYADILYAKEFDVNGYIIVMTDGANTYSFATEAEIQERKRIIQQKERLESLVTILVGINASSYRQLLEAHVRNVGFDRYIEAKDATPSTMAKLGGFISQSISSQAQSRGTGGPSQPVAATF